MDNSVDTTCLNTVSAIIAWFPSGGIMGDFKKLLEEFQQYLGHMGYKEPILC